MQIIDCPSHLANKVMGFRPAGLNDALMSGLSNFANTSIDKSVVQNAIDTFKANTSGAVYKAVKAIKNTYFKVFNIPDSIQYVRSLESLQVAPNSMVNLIMANPDIKRYYNDGIVEGYGNRYDGKYASVQKQLDPYYRQATNGMAIHEDGKIIIRNYVSNSKLRNLDLNEKICVLSAWDSALKHISEGYDPTSIDNNALG